MAQVFLSYARPNAAMAQALDARLRAAGYSVWLDDELPAHRAYADVIAQELDAAGAVVVIWSEAAVQSQWVRSEANRARELAKLVQMRIDGAPLPMPFDQLQCADLQSWPQDGPGWKGVIAGVAALIGGDGAPKPVPPAPAKLPSLAVMPFRDFSAEGDQGYFCEGIAEEIITALARLPGLRVASAFGDGAKTSLSAREAAQLLGVGAFLEGSIRKARERARIAVRLVGVDSGFALWSDSFDRSLADIFAVQDEIARAIVAALGVTLLERDARSIGLGASRDAKASDLYLRARHLLRQELEAEGRAAAKLFREAARIDPDFALALAGLAEALAQVARWRTDDWRQLADQSLAASERAIALTPELAEAHLARGAALRIKRDPAAHGAFARALELSPHDANVHYHYARFLVVEGDRPGAIRHYERAFALAPDDYRFIVLALQEYQALGDSAGEQSCLVRAATAIERHLAFNPADVRALGHGAGIMALLARAADAQRMIGQALALRPDDYANLCTLACAAVLNDDPEQALDLLESAVTTGRGDREWMIADNDLVPLHGHPRFDALIARMD